MESRAAEDDPIHAISYTCKDDSRRAGDRSDELNPTITESLMDSEESSFETPTTSSEDSIRKTERDNNEDSKCEKSKTAKGDPP